MAAEEEESNTCHQSGFWCLQGLLRHPQTIRLTLHFFILNSRILILDTNSKSEWETFVGQWSLFLNLSFYDYSSLSPERAPHFQLAPDIAGGPTSAPFSTQGQLWGTKMGTCAWHSDIRLLPW
jgi:hypothetical protein